MGVKHMERHEEGGFTLIEIVVVVALLGIIMSAISASLVMVIRTTGATATRSSQSHDAQLLSTYLIPDLQSAAGPTGIHPLGPDPLINAGTCATGTGGAIGSLELTWTDAASGIPYRSRYAVDPVRLVLTRTYTEDGVTSPPMVVAHNLEDPRILPVGTAKPPVCYQMVDNRVTLTINTLVNAESSKGSSQYAFSVSGQTRSPFDVPPPPPAVPPVLTSLVAVDIAPRNGLVDTVVATFDQPVGCPSGCAVADWRVFNQPGRPVAPAFDQPATITPSANTVRLNVTEAGAPDTAAVDMKVELIAGSLRDLGGNAISFLARDAADGMPPLLVRAASADGDGDGRLDGIDLTFSEPLDLAPRKQDHSVTELPSGSTIVVDSAAIPTAGDTYTLPLTEAAVMGTTAVPNMRISVLGGTGTDLRSNTSLSGDVAVGDGIAPVLDPGSPPIARDLDGDGLADHVELLFSEPLAAPNPGTAFALANVPSDGSLRQVTATGAMATLTLNEGADPPDTIMSGFTVGLVANPSGIRDVDGNLSRFSARTVLDGAAPILLSLKAPVNGANLEVGKLEAGDQLDITFSEPLATLPPPGAVMGAEDGTGSVGTTFTVPGLLDTFEVDAMSHYTQNQLQCGIVAGALTSPAAVRVTVTGCTAGALKVAQADVGRARISAAARDAAGNAPPEGRPLLPLPLALYF